MTRGTFVIDMSRCTGCQACSVACRDRADLPEGVALLRVVKRETGAFPRPLVRNRVMHCFHCDLPPCVEACPDGALSKDTAGFVVLAADRCTGCGACRDACPFGVVAELPDGRPAICDACRDEVAAGWGPTCVRACPMRALAHHALGEGVTGASRSRDPDFDEHAIGPGVVFLTRAPATACSTAAGQATGGC